MLHLVITKLIDKRIIISADSGLYHHSIFPAIVISMSDDTFDENTNKSEKIDYNINKSGNEKAESNKRFILSENIISLYQQFISLCITLSIIAINQFWNRIFVQLVENTTDSIIYQIVLWTCSFSTLISLGWLYFLNNLRIQGIEWNFKYQFLKNSAIIKQVALYTFGLLLFSHLWALMDISGEILHIHFAKLMLNFLILSVVFLILMNTKYFIKQIYETIKFTASLSLTLYILKYSD